MSAESIKENAIRKAIQELIVPDLQKLISKGDILEERINSVKNELKADIGRLDEKIDTKITALDEKIDSVKSELKSDIAHLDEKVNSVKNEIKADIAHLDEKVDLMNKFNERLFNLIHPAGQKQS